MSQETDLSAYSLFSPELQSNPFDFYKLLHEKCPVYKMPENGFYMLSRYDDVYDAAQNWSVYSSVMERIALLQGENGRILLDVLRDKGWEHMPTLQRADPPQHARYRKIIDRALNIKHVRNLAGRMTEVVNDLIDKFIDRGQCDFIEEFAFPFPGTIIAELVGLQSSDWPTYRKWAENILAYSGRKLTAEELQAAAVLELDMQHILAGILEDRRKNPREDLMTSLVTAYEGEEPLSMHELQNIMHQLISGGYDTVPTGLNHTMLRLVEYPDIAERLRKDPSLTRNFIDESLRFESPVQGHVRKVVKNVVVEGVTIPEGSFCMMRWGAANRDETRFPNADQLIPERENAGRHVGFGAGPHVCPGMMLARQELTIAVNLLLARLDNIELATPQPTPRHKPSLGLHPLRELNIKFTKRA